VAGAAVAFIGGEAVLGLGAAAYVVAVPWLMIMSRHLRQVAVAPEPYLAAVLRGLAAVWGDPVLKGLVGASAIANLGFLGPFLVGLPAFVRQVLGGDASLFGVLLAAFGGGSLLGAIIAGRISHGRQGRTTAVGLAVAATAFGLVSTADSLGWALGLLAVAGVGSGLANVQLTALLQLRSDPSMVGRVMGLVLFGSFALTPISQAGAGIIVETFGPQLVFLVGACISLIGVAVAAPALRRADAA
jgi:MFS family permease